MVAWLAVALLSEYDLSKAFTLLEGYDLVLLTLGLAALAAAVVPRLLFDKPLTLPMVLLALGFAVFALPLGLESPDPLEQGKVTERLTELGVIVALMGAGLKLDRPPHWLTWRSTWLLLVITMPLTIAAAALLGWWVAGFVPATAMLLGAVIAPTDPVLASEVQVGAPGEGYEAPAGEEEDEVRFSLTAEAGLNDGLAFPFTYMAIAIAIAGPAPGNWIGSWFLVNVLYKLGVGFVVGLLLGWVLARTILAFPAETELAKAITGLSALAATLLVYGATEYAGGYGFIAVFVAAVVIRNYERDHEYQESLHIFTEQAENLLTAGIVLALGGAIAGGILAPLSWQVALVGILLVFVVRPLAGMIGLAYFPGIPWRERAAISFFGIRGIGSLYYLSYALNEAEFPAEEVLWALVAFVVMLSIIIHGLAGAPVMSALDKHRKQLLREESKPG
jgi:NhaP-type Na+/H+ or K+/H+ antiporter